MPRLPDCRIVGKELTFVFPSNSDALVGYRMIRDAVDAAEKAVAPPAATTIEDLAGTVWVHRKTGFAYRVLFECIIEATLAPVVAYSRYDGLGHIWIRPRDEFLDGRFRRETSTEPAVAPPAPAPKPPLQLRVGAHYKRSDGMVGRVLFCSTASGVCLWKGTDGVQWAFNKDGTSRVQHRGNLIEEIASPPCPTIHDCRAGQTERCTCCDKEG